MDAVEDIKGKLSIEDVAADYMELKRSGRNLKGLSPFSNEKTPSLMVSPEKQIWHDFSSGKGGDMFTLVMELEGLDFKGALELLARKAGVDLAQYRTSGGQDNSGQKNKIYDCLEAAAKFYQVQFSKNNTALEYILKKRAYTKETALQFRIGYSPNNGRALLDFLGKKGFSEDVIKKSGLATVRYAGASDMFRGRIMIPLQDSSGRVIGFTARALNPEDTGPKYINTPQTMVYDKGRHAYGLHLAKDSIRKKGYVVVVEGNLDVIASHQAGVENVVATAGTAMTEMHLKELARFTRDLRLAFDQDQAGLNAMERIIPIASSVDVALSIISVPEGKDPDELIQKDPGLWVEAVNTYEYAIDWLIRRQQENLDITSGSGKKALTDAILPVVAKLSDSVEKDHYLDKLAGLIDIEKDALIQKLNDKKTVGYAKRLKKVDPPKTTKADADTIKTQKNLLSLCYAHSELRNSLKHLEKDMFSDEKAELAFVKLKNSDQEGKELFEGDNYGKILSVLYEELYQNLDYVELPHEANRLQIALIRNYAEKQKAELRLLMQNASEVEKTELQAKDKELNELLKKAKEQ